MDNNFVAGNIILNSLKGNKQLQVYEDPASEITKICEEIKRVVSTYHTGIPDDIPVKLNDKVMDEIFTRTVNRNWKVETIDNKQRKELIVQFANELPLLKNEKIHVAKEMLEEKDDFILELKNLPKDQRIERLLEWSSYDLEGLFDQVSTSDSNQGDSEYDKFYEEYMDQEKTDSDVLETRTFWTKKLYDIYSKSGKKSPTRDYIRYTLMPKAIYQVGKKKIVDHTKEYTAYMALYNYIRKNEM